MFRCRHAEQRAGVGAGSPLPRPQADGSPGLRISDHAQPHRVLPSRDLETKEARKVVIVFLRIFSVRLTTMVISFRFIEEPVYEQLYSILHNPSGNNSYG